MSQVLPKVTKQRRQLGDLSERMTHWWTNLELHDKISQFRSGIDSIKEWNVSFKHVVPLDIVHGCAPKVVSCTAPSFKENLLPFQAWNNLEVRRRCVQAIDQLRWRGTTISRRCQTDSGTCEHDHGVTKKTKLPPNYSREQQKILL